jgi:hypothetical protein
MMGPIAVIPELAWVPAMPPAANVLCPSIPEAMARCAYSRDILMRDYLNPARAAKQALRRHNDTPRLL